jgi:hypothetical protein
MKYRPISDHIGVALALCIYAFSFGLSVTETARSVTEFATYSSRPIGDYHTMYSR